MLTIVTIHDTIIGQNTTSSGSFLTCQITKAKSTKLTTSAAQAKTSLIIVRTTLIPPVLDFSFCFFYTILTGSRQGQVQKKGEKTHG